MIKNVMKLKPIYITTDKIDTDQLWVTQTSPAPV